MSSEVNRFVQQLLLSDPGPVNSVQLDMDVDGDVCALFEVLLLIMTDILKSWYAPPITISAITPLNLAKLVGYFASFGIRFDLQVENIPRVLRINNRDYTTKSRLEDMKFQMADSEKLYTVRFNVL